MDAYCIKRFVNGRQEMLVEPKQLP